MDGPKNTIIYDDCVPVEHAPELNPSGCAFKCAFKVNTTAIQKPSGYDLDLTKGRVYKIINESKINPNPGSPVGYKLHLVPSQMLLMGPETFNYQRGIFGTNHVDYEVP